MKSHHILIVSAVAWSAAVTLTFVATLRPQLALVAAMWAVCSLAVAVTASVAALLNRHQYETVEDVRVLLEHRRAGQNGTSLSRI